MEELHARYFRERHHVNTLELGRILEAAFTLRLAEQNRTAGNFARARELIAFAVETCPKHVGLRNFEASIQPRRPGCDRLAGNFAASGGAVQLSVRQENLGSIRKARKSFGIDLR